MGILTNANPGTYYGENGVHGEYRFISLSDVIKSFMATYVGEGKICENVTSEDISFHAIRGLQELSYDTLRSTKEWEIVVPPALMLVMPIDYVSYVKLSWSDDNGVERVLYPTGKTSNPSNITETITSWGGFDTGSASTDITSTDSSDTMAKYKAAGDASTSSDTDTDLDGYGSRYGIDPQHAHINGTFLIDHKEGKPVKP